LQGGASYKEEDSGKICTCGIAGILCECPIPADHSCAAGSKKWIDEETCDVKCIKSEFTSFTSYDIK